MLPTPPGNTPGVGELVQVEHGTHLADLAVALTGDAAVVVDHVVTEVPAEGFGLRQQEAQAQLEQASWPEVSQSESLGHDIFQPPIRSLFLVGFRQIQIVLPDILQGGRKAPRRERKKSFEPFFKGLCVPTGTGINHHVECFRRFELVVTLSN